MLNAVGVAIGEEKNLFFGQTKGLEMLFDSTVLKVE